MLESIGSHVRSARYVRDRGVQRGQGSHGPFLRDQFVRDGTQHVHDWIAGVPLQIGGGVTGVHGNRANFRVGVVESSRKLEDEEKIGEF